MRPSLGRSSRRISRRKVDLPEPDGPTRNTNSPFSTSRLTFSRAGRLWLVYVLVTLSKWITGPSHVLDDIRTHAATGTGCPPLGPSRLTVHYFPVWPDHSLGGKFFPDVQ